MTLNAFLETQEGARASFEHALSGDVVALPGQERLAPVIPRSVRRAIDSQLQVIASILCGITTALLVGSDPAVAAGVLMTWQLVHLQLYGVRVRPGIPDLATATRHVALPFALIGLAALVGMVPVAALPPALLVAIGATGGSVLTALAQRGRRSPTKVLVVGDRAGLGRVVTRWTARPDVALIGVAVFGDRSNSDAGLDFETFGLFTTQGIDDLAEHVERLGVESVVVLPSPGIGSSDIRRLSWALEGTGTTLALKVDLDSVATHRLSMSSLAGCTFAEIGPSRAPIHVRGLKALIDRLCGSLLLVLFAPLLLVMIVIVRLESPGGGLFTQVRAGQHGRHFRVYKMRTMYVDAEDRKGDLDDLDEGNGVLFKVKQDPRITRCGRLLRRTSLDELPQLINVVRGEMSLVGPRPALPDEVARYDETALRRLAVRPGMTGLWQVSGRSDLDWDTTVALDVSYTDNVTIADDLRICLRTVRAVTSGRGAY